MTFRLPDTLIIGPMRTGTTWVYEYFKARGDICLPDRVKETFFFDRRCGKDISWYAWHFRRFVPGEHLRIAEVAPSYFHSKVAPKRIHEHLGAPKLVVFVRDPVERSISHYRHLRRRGLVGDEIKEAVQRFPEIVGASRYAEHLETWADTFGNSNTHLFWHDKLCSEPQSFATELCHTLDIPYGTAPQELVDIKINTTGIPFSASLARAGLKAADRLRERRMYAPVELAKKLGLKKVFFGSERAPRKVEVSRRDYDWLADTLEEDWERFNRLTKNGYKNVS